MLGFSWLLNFSLTGWWKISSRIDFITAKHARRSAFLGPKQICRTTIVLRSDSEVWTDYTAFVLIYYVFTSKWGRVSATKIVYGNGVLARTVYCISKWSSLLLLPGSSRFAKWWLGARNAYSEYSVVMNIPSLGIQVFPSSLSPKMTSRQAISTVFPSNGLAMRALQQPWVAEVLWTFRNILKTLFIFHTSKQMYVPDLTSLRTLVIVVVTILFANTRHPSHRRH